MGHTKNNVIVNVLVNFNNIKDVSSESWITAQEQTARG